MIRKYGAQIGVGREVAIAYGLVEPTAEEAAEAEKRHEEFRARHVAYAAKIHTFRQAMAQLKDAPSRAVLSLHAETPDGECAHCYGDTEMGDREEWPCGTAIALATAHGIEVPTW